MFEVFETELKNMAKWCSYDKPDEVVPGRTVSGITSQVIREKLLNQGGDLTRLRSRKKPHVRIWSLWLPENKQVTVLMPAGNATTEKTTNSALFTTTSVHSAAGTVGNVKQNPNK